MAALARRVRGRPLISRIPLAIAATALLLASPAAGRGGAPADDEAFVVRYSFDDERVETGPDTFAVYQHARGSVTLSSAYRVSGYHAVEIRDVAGDGDFPELQGTIPLRRSGLLYVHFALMTTAVDDALNFALAGPAGFRLARDGIAFWLRIREGWLEHVSDSMPKKLFRPEPFVWYRIELAYAIDAGRYDLSIGEEDRDEVRVSLRQQAGAASQAGSAVDKFSFIGDVGTDRSNVVYYVDDVWIGPSSARGTLPLVAPGRRRLFFDGFLEARERRHTGPCLEDARLADFGIDPRAAQSLTRGPLASSLQHWLEGRPAAAGSGGEDALVRLPEPLRQRVLALRLWAEGCSAAASGEPQAALEQLAAAHGLAPDARMAALSHAIALALADRRSESEQLFARHAAQWQGDPREPIALARLGLALGEPEDAEWWLRERAGAWLDDLPDAGDPAIGARIADSYFHVLLWLGRGREAAAFAGEAAARAARPGGPAVDWIERAGDAAFVAGDHAAARADYERALDGSPAPARLQLKLSDLHHLRGDLVRERACRERIYGTLLGAPARLD